jgi:hypothetical protein
MSSETFRATIKKFNTDITSFDIYNCNQFTAKLTCKETWYWSKSKNVKTKFEQISETDCKAITKQALAGSHKFKKVKNNRWESISHDEFDCRWAKTTTRKYVHRTVSKYRAAVKGADQELIMGLSKTRCYHDIKFCNLKEDGSTLIWDLTKHKFRKLKPIGQFMVHKAGEYYVIPKLRSGGHAIEISSLGYEIQLASGLIISRLPPRDPLTNTERPKDYKKFFKDALRYFKTFGNNEQLGIMGSHITNMMTLIEGHLDLLYQRTCSNEEVTSKIKRFVITNFPHAGVSMISRKQGVILVPKGDAFLLAECENMTIAVDDLVLNRKIKETCYKDFPVTKDNITIGFLHLPDHKMLKKSPEIACKEVTIAFIEDTDNLTYLISPNNTLIEIQVSSVDSPYLSKVQEIFGYAGELIEDRTDLLDQPSLLQLVSETSAPLNQLRHLHELGDGNICVGVAQVFSAIFHAAACAGGFLLKTASTLVTKVIASFATGTSKLVKTTAEGGATLISSAGHGIEEIGEGLGSIFGSFLPWLNLVAITATIAYITWKERRGLPVLRRGPLPDHEEPPVAV